MTQATWQFTGEEKIPAVIRVGGNETPVWMQGLWTEGEFAQYIRNNGCGHCCTAMAARLRGVRIDPYQEYVHCRKLWGAPKEADGQGHWLTTAGVAKVLNSLGVKAEAFGVKQDGPQSAVQKILIALEQGKQVIFTSNPDDYPDNPFSKGYHWVMAVCIEEDGRILIANSSHKAAPSGIQHVTSDVIEKALFREATAPQDMTWGEEQRIHVGSGYIIVG